MRSYVNHCVCERDVCAGVRMCRVRTYVLVHACACAFVPQALFQIAGRRLSLHTLLRIASAAQFIHRSNVAMSSERADPLLRATNGIAGQTHINPSSGALAFCSAGVLFLAC